MSLAMHASLGARALLVASLTLGSACSDELGADAQGELDLREDALSSEGTSKIVTPTQPATLALGGGATLSVPRGAVARPTRVGLRRPGDREARALIGDLEESGRLEVASAPYILTPHGTRFRKDVSVSLPITTRARDADLYVVSLEDEDDRDWELLAVPQRRGNRATFQIDHFSVVMLVRRLPEDGGARDAGSPDAEQPDAALPDAYVPDAGEADAGSSSCGPAGAPGVFMARVVDAITPSTWIAGVTVIVLDDVTGLPVEPAIQAVSASDGCVQLPVGAVARFGVRALGNESYTDSYTYHLGTALPEPLIRMGSNAVGVVIPAVAQYEARADRAPVAGTVYWKTADVPFYDVIGCAHIETDNGDAVAQDLRYFAANIPSSPTEWPLEQGTRPGDGRFFLGNALPGTHTLTARLADGTAIGSTQLVVFPRSSASTQVNGSGHNLFFAPIYIEAAPGSAKPGCSP